VLQKFGRRFVCFNGRLHHHEILLSEAIAQSCDIYFYEVGWRTTPEGLADEARRFGFGRPTGIELPNEKGLSVPDPAWKEKTQHEKWFPGDTANMAIGQGFVEVTPLQMACFVASVARGEVSTKPTLVHEENRPAQHTESIGLTPEQRRAIFDGMEGCVTHGSAKLLASVPGLLLPGIRLAGKTGTAQKTVTVAGKTGIINYAWFICFAPAEKPEIAIAVMLEGDTPGEEFGGGRHSAPVAAAIVKKYFEKKKGAVSPVFRPLKSE
jgi:penicillin-binding protein 2